MTRARVTAVGYGCDVANDPVRVAHLGRKNEVTAAYVEGNPIKALCGIRFIPSSDPERLPDCEDCRVMLALLSLMKEWAEMDEDERARRSCVQCGGPLLRDVRICICCHRQAEGLS